MHKKIRSQELIKIQEIEKVNDIELYSKEILWIEDKVYYDSEIIASGEIQILKRNRETLYIGKNNSSTIINLNNLEQYSIDRLGELISGQILLSGKWNKTYTKRFVTAINLINETELWSRESYFGNIYYEENKLFGSLYSNIYRIDQQTGEVVWQYSLKQHGKYTVNGETKEIDVQQTIGIFNNSIYFKIGNKKIIGLEITTGNLIYESQYKEGFLVLDNLRIDSERKLIFSIGPTNYIEFYLDKNNYKLFNLSIETVANDIQLTRLGNWKGDKIYFWEGGSVQKFGIFNRNNKSIELAMRIEKMNGRSRAILKVLYDEQKIYILDQLGKLHIYRT